MKIASTVLLAAFASVSGGSAMAESRTYDVSPFSEVGVSDGIVALVEVGGPQSVTAEAVSASVLNRLKVEVRGQRLELHTDWNVFNFIFNFGRRDEIVVHVSTPAITAGEASSGANLDISKMTGDTLSLGASSGASLDASEVGGKVVRADSSSGANLKVAGTCTNLAASASSGASLDARDLVCEAVDVDASSGAHAIVSTTRAVKANASSGGGITVYGAPTEIEVDSSSGGSIDFSK